MAKAVFTTRADTAYKDIREEQYHFPRTYLRQVEQALNDWIVYYEPRRGEGRQAYFAVARVDRIAADPEQPDHFFAYVGDYLEFPNPVPFREATGFYERALEGPNGQTNLGSFQRAVRILPDYEYDTIVRTGLGSVIVPESWAANVSASPVFLGEEITEYQRPVIEQVTKRLVRDEAFRRKVEEAYDSTCAMTGLRIINGGGRAEIEAAHIKPVGDNHKGPDSVRNGVALSRTLHWLFDRGLLSISGRYEILTAKHLVPQQVERLLNPDRNLLLPKSPLFRPHPEFLRYHREHVFKGG